VFACVQFNSWCAREFGVSFAELSAAYDNNEAFATGDEGNEGNKGNEGSN